MNIQDEYEVIEELPDHHFRTEIPNILFDIGLDVYTLGVYSHLKRIAGDRGASWKSNAKLAEAIGISERKLIDVIKILENYNTILKSPLIKIKRRFKPDGSPDTSLITIINIWGINGKINRDSILEKKSNKEGGGGARHAPGGARHAPGGAPGAEQEEPSQEELSQEEPKLPLSLPSLPKVEEKRSESKSESSKEILVYKDKSGNFLEVNLSQICRRFAFQNYSIQEIKEAMQITRDNGEPLDDVYAYITGIIANLRNKNRKDVYNKQVKDVKCSDDDYAIPIGLYKELARQLLDGIKTSEQADLIVQPEHKQKWKEIYEEVKAKRLSSS